MERNGERRAEQREKDVMIRQLEDVFLGFNGFL
jgi:hypothetical protein